jgi:hypothetical protein
LVRPAVAPEGKAWDKSRIVGQKRPRLPRHFGLSVQDWSLQTAYAIWPFSLLQSIANRAVATL